MSGPRDEERPTLRPARPEDDAALAELTNEAGEGLPLYVWTRLAGPGENPRDVGRRRARREDGGFSFRHAVIAELGDETVGCLIGYALPEESEPIDESAVPAMFLPLLELEALVPGAWYVNVLAVVPEQRGRGIGARLLAEAERLAHGAGCRRLGVTVTDTNTVARRLYERTGYVELARRPIVKNGWHHPGGQWVLLEKRLAEAA